jgi:hypothetical protein
MMPEGANISSVLVAWTFSALDVSTQASATSPYLHAMVETI